jgi:hypothetical protein
MDWDRLATQMIREMIRQFLKQPGEFLTFGQLVFRIPGADKDVLHVIVENRPDLFLITRDDRSVRLYTDALQKILQKGVELTIAEVGPSHSAPAHGHDRDRCSHPAEEEILANLVRCSLPPEALTRNRCWKEICRVRALNQQVVDSDTWREVCHVRGYLQERQNPRGF